MMKRKSRLKLIAVLAALIAGAFVVIFWSWIPISNTLQWTCAKTGSQKGRQVYFGFITTGIYFRPSGLELFLAEKGHANIEHEWVKTVGTERYVLAKTHWHSRAPASYHFKICFEAFMEMASDDEKLRMMNVFLSGPEDARKAFLREAEQVAFKVAEP